MPRITGREGVQVRLKSLIDEASVRRVGAALFAGGELIRGEASHMITEGAVSGKNHVPSNPGQAPHNDTGTLVSHIETTQPAPLKVEVSSNAPAAVILEFGGTIHHPGGTPYFIGKDGMAVFVSKSGQGAYHHLPVTKPHNITIAERPYMRPATARKRKEVVALVRRAVTAATKR